MNKKQVAKRTKRNQVSKQKKKQRNMNKVQRKKAKNKELNDFINFIAKLPKNTESGPTEEEEQ